MKLPRNSKEELLLTAHEYPVITVIGPRQAGKTTLVRGVFEKHQYVNLENPELSTLAIKDPKTFLQKFPPPVILDEIQNIPELLSWIQVDVDQNPEKKALYVLTGSHQLALREAITQSLAGRTAVFTLLPFNLEELGVKYAQKPRNELIFNGFLPRIHDQKIRPLRAYRDYYQTYVERDVRTLLNIQNQNSFELFLKLLAGRVGQEVNYNSLATQVGISATQIKKWISVLEASFIIFKLPPYFKNFNKRLTKSPKIYFTEVGLVSYLLGLETVQQVEDSKLLGELFENMVILEAYKNRLNQGLEPNMYFYRDKNQHEVDLLFPMNGEHIPIEIKSSRTFRSDFDKGLKYFQKLSGAPKGVVLYDGDLEFENDELKVSNFRGYFNQFDG